MPRELNVSPVGLAEWAKILEPADCYEAGNGQEYSIDLILDPSDGATLDFVNVIEEFYRESHGNAPVAPTGWPFADHEVDKKSDGMVRFRFKRSVLSAKGNLLPEPRVVDSMRQPWNKSVLIGNGSKIKVAFTMYGWSARKGNGKGVSLSLESVQVLDLVPYERVDPVSAFEDVPGGYVNEVEDSPFPAAAPAAAPARPSAMDLLRRLPTPDEAVSDEEVPF